MFSVITHIAFSHKMSTKEALCLSGLVKVSAMTFMGTLKETDNGLQELPLEVRSFKGEGSDSHPLNRSQTLSPEVQLLKGKTAFH